jgi:hypothetical protein
MRQAATWPAAQQDSLELTEMRSHKDQLRELDRADRFRTLRNWAVCLGLVALILAWGAAGFGGVISPDTWSSLYSAMARDGWMRWLAVPLAAAGMALLIVGAVLHGLYTRRHGEF